jgi:branched-chain amino acid transport system permease protein
MASDLVFQLIAGVTTAAVYFLVAAGLTLAFGAMRIINIAHGSLYMYGAFIISTLLGAHVPFILALFIAPAAVLLIGVVLEVAIMRRLYAREHLAQLLATYAVFLILADVALQLWGGTPRSISPPHVLNGAATVASRTIPVYNIFIIGVACAIGLILWFGLQRTQIGWRIRAAVEDSEMLLALGVNLKLLYTTVFAVGALLAGAAGALVAPTISIGPGLDGNILIAAFVVAVIGGLGSIAGAALGALIIGVFSALIVLFAPSFSSASVYIAMILILIVRPWGVLGTADQ